MINKNLTIEYHLVDSCNLKCAGCSHYSSLLDKLTYIRLEDIINDLTLLKDKVDDNLTMLRLLGGEPLLHPQICECLIGIRNMFQKTDIVVVTNGILIENMTEEFYNICSKTNIQIKITDYNLFNTTVVLNKLRSLGINAEIYRKSYIWHYKNIRLTEGKIDCLSNCKLKNECNNYRNGKIYLCPHIAYVDFFNTYFKKNIILDKTDYISLKEISSFEDLLEKIHSLRSSFCYNYCNCYDKTHPKKGKWHITKRDINEFCLTE